ncbi:diguanylate cyclase [Undibacterium sp. SXout11W]|uniref:sensor domain-containing diguanylate cyclase n=1 Tax=Undibacterium sp. SXout11W TaxID=3413050 RepID=UPI003BF24653
MTSTALQPIASTLIRRVFKWVILCVICFSSIQAWLNYNSIEKNFNATINDVANTHLPLLSVAIWDIEPQTIQKQISLILKNTSIAYVTIKASTGQEFSGGNASLSKTGKHMAFNIPAPIQTDAAVGTLDLVVDRSILQQELIQNFVIVLIEVLLLAVLILLAVVAILRRDLERPMHQLATYVKNIQADQLSDQLNLDLPHTQTYNEINLVLDGFHTMQKSIQQHIQNQDALVMERTIQLEKAMASLKLLSITDGLTGCYNRLLFNERLPGEIFRSTRYERDLSIVFCDIDYFKKVNDKYGHSVGDKVLVAFAQCIKNELRTEIDWIVRYGGEEFIVVLPETSLKSAIDVAERMCNSVKEKLEVLIATGEILKITASFGVAQKNAKDDLDSLVERADQCLYIAKTGGRNQVQPKNHSPFLAYSK